MEINIGANIRRIRISRDMEQQELARYVGIAPPAICMYEKGTKLPSLPTAIKISKVLRCSMDELCGTGTGP
ncbi:MAG: helix-turn-helix transcriptional regulator [Ruminococcus sp.]|nr:helix-turn-helix transcriptional regulator [Ruminococcus sp.]